MAPAPNTSDKPERLMDTYLPAFQVSEVHAVEITAAADTIFQILPVLDMNPSKIIKTLFFLRGLPAGDIRMDRFLSLGPFEIIESRPSQELLIGLAVGPGFRFKDIKNRSWFRQYRPDRGIKILMDFCLGEIPGTDRCRLSTETRVLCFGRATSILFSGYWCFIRPFSGIIRKEMLRLIKAEAERPADRPPKQR